MSAAGENRDTSHGGGESAQERAEELMERVASDASRLLTRFVGRAREEIEDLVADARSLNRRNEP